MASRVTIYGTKNDSDMKRLRREMNVMLVEYEATDPSIDQNAKAALQEWGTDSVTKPVVEVKRGDDNGSVFLINPDEPTLRQCLYSEGILSVTSYWI